MDPYSHTPGHVGAQQPGMTGQVKEEILTRFGELGVIYKAGQLHIHPRLLRESELLAETSSFEYLDTQDNWQKIRVPAGTTAFTLCQIPVILEFVDGAEAEISISKVNGDEQLVTGQVIPAGISQMIIQRLGTVTQIHCRYPKSMIFNA